MRDAILLGAGRWMVPIPAVLWRGLLRATWLAYLMTDSIPLAVILQAAGLKSARIRAVPYFMWDNRGDGGEMRVWIRRG